MPVFGFVLTLDPRSLATDALLTRLASESGVTLGERLQSRLPIVLELDARESHEDRVSSWLELPGVVHVDYAFADFDDLVGDAREGDAS